MDERGRRAGLVEAVFRRVNDEIEALDGGLARPDEETLEIVCECGDLQCTARVAVPVSVYERARAESSLFLVVPGHEIPSVERVVEATERYAVVRKHEGEPRELSEATDPRS